VEEVIRIILADDHAVVRQGTAELLRQEKDLDVVAEAENGLQAVELAKRLIPDIVVMDIRMPELSGIDATKNILETMPGVRVLVLTAHEDDQYLFSLLQAGASGYLLKTAPVSELIRAIRQVHEGRSYIDPSIVHKLVERFSARKGDTADLDEETQITETLTARELEVLNLLARGLNNRAIADALVISERTVQAHLTSIFSKMQVSSRLEAVMTAIRLGWLKSTP
jgi:NarL family two-component system response regulator LiaR